MVVNAPLAALGDSTGAYDEYRSGLLCRADRMCRRTFPVAPTERCERAAIARDAHEVNDHGYLHVKREIVVLSFAQLGQMRKGRTRK